MGGLAGDVVVDLLDPRNVVVIVGPTSAGKSKCALQLAQRLPLEIICMDSMQLYQELNVGVARPKREEEAQVPHHLFGAFSVTKPLSSVRYAEEARAAIVEVQSRGKIPTLVGGTGLYLRAIFQGMNDLPKTPKDLRDHLTQRVQRKGPGTLYRLLKRLDPKGAARLHPNDRQRVQRFLEVRLLTGESMLDHWDRQAQNQSQQPLIIGLHMDRSLLVQRIEANVRQMLDGGWLEEVKGLDSAGLYLAVCELGPLGYHEVWRHLNGELQKDALVERIVILTRQYAKRQMTWFRKLEAIRWFPFSAKSGYNVNLISEHVHGRVGSSSSSSHSHHHQFNMKESHDD